MADFQVNIFTPVQLEGAKQLADQLEREIGKCKALGQAYEEKEKQLKSVQAAMSNASKEATVAVEKEVLTHRELHESIRGVSQAMGGLGEVGLLLSAPTAALFGLLEVVKELQENYSQLREMTLENIKASNELRDSFAENLRGAILHVNEQLAEFHEAMSHVGRDQDWLGDSLKNNTELLNAQANSVKSLAAAELQLNDARIEGARLAGMISDPMAHFAEEQLRQESRRQQEQTEHERGTAEISAKRTASSGYASESDAARTAADKAITAKATTDAGLADAKVMLEKAKAAVKTMEGVAAEAKLPTMAEKAQELYDPAGYNEARAKKMADANQAVVRAKAQERSQEETLSRLTIQSAAQDREITRLTTRAEKMKELAEETKRAADEAQRLLSITEQGHAGVDATEDETKRIQRLNELHRQSNAGTLAGEGAVEYAGATAGNVRAAISRAQSQIADIRTNVQFREGGHASPQEVAKLVELNDFLIGLAENQQSQHGNLLNKIHDMMSRVQNLESRANHNQQGP